MDRAADILDIIATRKVGRRAVRAGDRGAHGGGDRRKGRRQGGDPARRHHFRRLDRRRLRARRGAQGGARRARRRHVAPRLGAAARPARRARRRGRRERDGVRFAKNMCPSKGTMDIFVEPVLPRPQVVICGSSPVAVAVADLARRTGFAVTICAPAAEQSAFAEADAASKAMRCRSRSRRPLCRGLDAGRGDEAALAGGARGRCRLRRLRRQPQESRRAENKARRTRRCSARMAKLKAPAGLDLGAITPDEIAISILAEIVAARRTGSPRCSANFALNRHEIDEAKCSLTRAEL